MEELEIKGIKYISSKRAAKLTGYAKDYVGQLARANKVPATRVGRAWYVSESDILAHAGKEETNAETTSPASTALADSPIPQEKENTRSLHELQTGKATASTRLKTWSSVQYFDDDYSLLPQKIQLAKPVVSVKNIVPENIVISAQKTSLQKPQTERAVHINKSPAKANRTGASIDGVSLAVPKKEVAPTKHQSNVKKEKQQGTLKRQSSKNLPVLSTLALGGVTAGFLVLILSGNVVPVEWGGNTGSLAFANASSTPALEIFIQYLRGVVDSAILLITTLFSTIFSMFWQYVSSGVAFLISLF